MTLLSISFEIESLVEPNGQNALLAQLTQVDIVRLVPSFFVPVGHGRQRPILVVFLYVPGIHGICEENAGIVSTLGPTVEE